MKLFRDLNAAEEAAFKQWARDHYAPFGDISGLWHPIVQAECIKINAEADFNGPSLAVQWGMEGNR